VGPENELHRRSGGVATEPTKQSGVSSIEPSNAVHEWKSPKEERGGGGGAQKTGEKTMERWDERNQSP